VPTQFTCDGNDAPPPIAVPDPPEGTESFAVIMDDPDALKGHTLARARFMGRYQRAR